MDMIFFCDENTSCRLEHETNLARVRASARLMCLTVPLSTCFRAVIANILGCLQGSTFLSVQTGELCLRRTHSNNSPSEGPARIQVPHCLHTLVLGSRSGGRGKKSCRSCRICRNWQEKKIENKPQVSFWCDFLNDSDSYSNAQPCFYMFILERYFMYIMFFFF